MGRCLAHQGVIDQGSTLQQARRYQHRCPAPLLAPAIRAEAQVLNFCNIRVVNPSVALRVRLVIDEGHLLVGRFMSARESGYNDAELL